MLEYWCVDGGIAGSVAMRGGEPVVGTQEVRNRRRRPEGHVFVGRFHGHVFFSPQSIQRSTAIPIRDFSRHDHGVDGLAW